MKNHIAYLIKSIFPKICIVVGIIASFATIFSAFIGVSEIICLLSYRILIFGLIILVSIIISIIWAIIENKSISININSVSIKVKYGDIFSETGITVVQVDNAFNTKVNEDIISKNSVHGQFILRYFGGNIDELKSLIDEKLVEKNLYSPTKEGEEDDKAKEKYPIGTIIEITKDGHRFILLALTELKELPESRGRYKAECNFNQYQEALKNLYDYINQNSNGQPTNVSLLGATFSRLPVKNKKDLLTYMILQAKLNIYSGYTFHGGLNIILDKNNKRLKQEFILSDINKFLQ